MLGPLLPDLPAETKAELGALLPSLLLVPPGHSNLSQDEPSMLQPVSPTHFEQWEPTGTHEDVFLDHP